MREMKYSGVKWIGYIPKSYIPYRLKNLLVKEKDSIRVGPFGSALKGSDILEEGDYWVYNQRVVLDSSFESNNTYINKEKYDELYSFRVKAGDILCTTRGSIGKITRVPDNYNEGVIHPCIIRFRIDDSIVNYKLLELIFNHSDIVIGQLKTASNATTIDVVYSDSLKNITIPLGTLEQQDKLLHFLIPKCTQLDALISNAQQQIEKLKAYKQSVITETVTKGLDPDVAMRDSGVEWIGEIPEHWEISRIKNMFSLRNEKNYESDLSKVNLISLYTDLGVVQHSDLEETTGNKAVTAEGYKKVYNGDIIVNIILCWMGAVGKSAYNGVTSPAYDIYKPLQNTNSDYYHYLFRTKRFNGECYKYGRGIMMMRWRTYSAEFSSIFIPIPPIEEQQQIADYLDQKCEQIDRLIAIKQQKIEKLQQYKKSMIYEYVTGKKEVR